MTHTVRQPASLFIGRWQPFHEGHKRLIETVLKKGLPVLIAIRNTPLNEKNPYTFEERRDIIRGTLAEYGDLVEIMSIPDISEVCYGRDVGYGIRRIEMDKETEAISATDIRKRNDGPIVRV